VDDVDALAVVTVVVTVVVIARIGPVVVRSPATNVPDDVTSRRDANDTNDIDRKP